MAVGPEIVDVGSLPGPARCQAKPGRFRFSYPPWHYFRVCGSVAVFLSTETSLYGQWPGFRSHFGSELAAPESVFLWLCLFLRGISQWLRNVVPTRLLQLLTLEGVSMFFWRLLLAASGTAQSSG